MKLLCQGKGYRAEERYEAFVYRLAQAPEHSGEVFVPLGSRTMGRFYPSVIGLLGNPGDVVAVLQRLKEKVRMELGYIGYDRQPVLFPYFPHEFSHIRNWQVGARVGLAGNTVQYLRARIDRRTSVAARLLELRNQRYAERESKREAARYAGRRAFKAAERRERLAARAKQLPKGCEEILANLGAICQGIREAKRKRLALEQVKAQLAEMAQQWAFL